MGDIEALVRYFPDPVIREDLLARIQGREDQVLQSTLRSTFIQHWQMTEFQRDLYARDFAGDLTSAASTPRHDDRTATQAFAQEFMNRQAGTREAQTSAGALEVRGGLGIGRVVNTSPVPGGGLGFRAGTATSATAAGGIAQFTTVPSAEWTAKPNYELTFSRQIMQAYLWVFQPCVVLQDRVIQPGVGTYSNVGMPSIGISVEIKETPRTLGDGRSLALSVRIEVPEWMYVLGEAMAELQKGTPNLPPKDLDAELSRLLVEAIRDKHPELASPPSTAPKLTPRDGGTQPELF